MADGDATSESTRSYREILGREIEQGVRELGRPTGGLLTSALSAGLDLGFSVLLMAVMLTLVGTDLPVSIREILVANMYSVGLAGLHHSIAGTVEVLAGVFAGQGIEMTDFLHFLVWTTLGNAIGGVFFVALVKYAHVTQSNE